MAKYVTLWAAITDAHPDNSCLHFIPRDADPGYFAGDTEDGDAMQRCFSERVSFQDIRAVPVAAGGCSFHTHRSIHWGNRGRRSYTGMPRIALSFGFSTPDFEPPYFSPKSLPFPSLSLRVALTSAQVLNYATLATGDAQGWVALAGSMAGCTAERLKILHRAFQRHIKAFHPTYRKEIATKFVQVSMSLTPGGSLTGSEKAEQASAAKVTVAQPAQAQAEDGADSDDGDDVLEAMLNAENDSGEILFHDDFDLLNAEDGTDAALDNLRRGAKRRKVKRRAAALTEPSATAPAAQRPAGMKKKKKRRQ